MKSKIKHFGMYFVTLVVAFSIFSVSHAQPAQYDQAVFSQPELEQMLAPIALYPDSLLSHTLMASTYPTEVVEAAYWLRDNPGLHGEEAIYAAESMRWDISVKSLLPFPNLLNTMESHYDWTQNVGNAFLAQQAQVMDTIQVLRHRAMLAGYLRSDSRITVIQEGRHISISPAQPTQVYLPYYNPRVVYGHWSQPAYAPVMWAPWPGYEVRSHQSGWTWSPVATVVTVGVLFAIFDWNHRHVYHRPHVNYWHRHPHYAQHKYHGPQNHWRHDPRHRRDVPYRHHTVDRKYGKTARTYNNKVGPRPTARDIRSGKHKPQPVQHRSDRGDNHRDDHRKPGNNGSPKPNRDHQGAPVRNQGAPVPSVHNNDHSAPRGVVHGVRGTQPAANVREHRETKVHDDRRKASAPRDNGDRRHDSPSRDNDKRHQASSSKDHDKRDNDSGSRDDDRRRQRDRD